MISRCTCCDGRKKIIGLGGMIKECNGCNGVGFVDIKKGCITGSVSENLLEDIPVKIKRKYTKKPVLKLKKKSMEKQENFENVFDDVIVCVEG